MASFAAGVKTINLTGCKEDFYNGTLTGTGPFGAAPVVEMQVGIPAGMVVTTQNLDRTGSGTITVSRPTSANSGGGASPVNVTLKIGPLYWYAPNDQGFNLPPPCHSYYGMHPVGASQWINSSGYACGVSFDTTIIGQLNVYDDVANTVTNLTTPGNPHFGYATFCPQSTYGANSQPSAIDPVSGNLICAYDDGLRICAKPTTTGVQCTLYPSHKGFVVTNNVAMVDFADPVTPIVHPTAACVVAHNCRAVLQELGNQSWTYTDCNGTAHTLNGYSFILWTDVNHPAAGCNRSSTFTPIIAQFGNYPFAYGGPNSCGPPGCNAWAENPTNGQLIAYQGGCTLYSLKTSSDPYGTPWLINASFKTGAGGAANANGTGSCAANGPTPLPNINSGGLPALGILADGSGAIVSVVDQFSAEQFLWLWNF